MVVLVITQFILPLLNHYYVEPPQQLAEVAGLNLGREDRLIVYGQPRPSLVFYARRKAIMIPVNEEGNITQYLNHPGRTMLLLPQAMRGRLPLETMDYPVVLQRYGYILLSSQVYGSDSTPNRAARLSSHAYSGPLAGFRSDCSLNRDDSF